MANGRDVDVAGYLGWFFLGALAGAATALLLTPRTGRETREFLAEHGSDLWRTTQDKATEAQARAGDLLDRGRDYLDSQKHRVRSAFEAGRSAMREEMERGGLGT
ncbi:MAG: YtxH domain-containing protein [Candidatus Rokubacteria bacterium]|nr:YtxH domain-containing protein [Candidatus Rokubacteria bacterium]